MVYLYETSTVYLLLRLLPFLWCKARPAPEQQTVCSCRLPLLFNVTPVRYRHSSVPHYGSFCRLSVVGHGTPDKTECRIKRNVG
jgi:hypothetical protein